MHYVNKSVDFDSSNFRFSTGKLSKCVQQNLARAGGLKYRKEAFNYQLPKITSYSPVSDCNYKDFLLSKMMESIPKKSIKGRNGQDNDNIPRKEENASKLSNYAILPPVRKSTELINDMIEKEIYKGLGCLMKEYRRKVFLPVLYEQKIRSNERYKGDKEKPKRLFHLPSKPPPTSTSTQIPSIPSADDYILIPWDHTDSQLNS